MLGTVVVSDRGDRGFFGSNLKKNLLKNRLSIRVRNFAPLHFYKFFLF
jgi:hypothetical protein